MPIASVVSGQCKKMKNKHLLTFKAKEKIKVYEKTRKKKMKQIKYLLIIISIVLVGCNWTKHKEPKIRYTGYTLYQGMCDIHIDIKIDSVTSLENLIPRLEKSQKLYDTFRGWYIGYNDLMFSIAVYGDLAIEPLVDFYHQTKSYNAKIATLQTLHLIGINCRVQVEEQCEAFSNMNARKALLQILAEDDSLQPQVMMLLSRRALASDVPILMDILKESKSDCWGITCGLLRYKVKDFPMCQKVPAKIFYKKIPITFSRNIPDNVILTKVFEIIKAKYSDSISVEDTLLHYKYESKNTYSGPDYIGMLRMRGYYWINSLCDYCIPDFFEYGSNFQYYYKDNKLHFCSAQTSKKLWLEWWNSQTEPYKEYLKNCNEPIGTFSHRGYKDLD